jgi:hypothetical protein
MHTSMTFSAGGNLLERRHRNPDGSESSVVCRYDDHGRLSQKQHQDPKASQLFSYHYDALGRLERVVARSATGADRVCESYQYAAAGRKTCTVYPDPVPPGNIGVDMEAAFDISVEASSILTIFDERDRPVKRVFYGPNDVVERRVLMRYDTGGRLVEKGECEAEGIIREDLRHLYRYDVEGRLVEKTMYYYGLWTYWKTFVYNDQGDVVEERHRRTGGMVEEGGDQDWKTLSRYQYDDRGNWVERVAETVLRTGDRTLSMIERRSLNYY